MDLTFFEDVVVGEAPLFGDYEVTKEEIFEFATQFDPQPFHLDEEAAKKTLLGGLSASGWHTAAISMRLLYDSFLVHAASMGAPGVDELKWLKPVRPGDRLSLRANVLEKKESQSRPDLGIIQAQSDVINQNGEVVMTHRAPLMLRRRGKALQVQSPDAPRKAAPQASQAAGATPFHGAFFEDLEIGQRVELESFTFEKPAMVAFAKKYDPQPFHVDEAAARKSHFGGLIASGWYTASVFMRQLIDNRDKFFAENLARSSKLPELGPSPGFNNLRWRAPVYAGDRLRFTSEIASKRVVSRPGWGLVFIQNKAFNQDERFVYEFQGIGFWQLRP
ncbi:MAG: MaoC family dehydratase [Beijerinckiaceae bacterium]